jgi:hypothetical protein
LLQASSGNGLGFLVNGGTTFNMFINSSGNVGIGTTSPSNRLVVSNGGANGIEFDAPNGTILTYNRSTSAYSTLNFNASEIVSYISGSERMRITSGGNLLIGTTTGDGYKLQISGGSQASATFGQTYSGVAAYSQWVNSSGAFVMGLDAAAGTTERMRITSGGSLLVGTTTEYSGYRFQVSGANSANSYVAYFLGGSSSSNGINMYLPGNRSSDTTYDAIALGDDSAYRFKVFGNGNVVNTNNSYGSISDIRLKENISDTTSKLSDLLKVKVRNYNLIGDDKKQIGVIAQELETIFPSMVEVDGKSGMKQVKYSVFVPMLIKAIQELNDKIK